MLDDPGAFSSEISNLEQWLQLDLGERKKVGGVVMQGRDADGFKYQFVTEYNRSGFFDFGFGVVKF